MQSGGILSINSHSAVYNFTLAGGELASSGVDLVNGYGSWSLQGASCTITGGVDIHHQRPSRSISTCLTNGFVVETGSTLEITGSLKNGQAQQKWPGRHDSRRPAHWHR